MAFNITQMNQNIAQYGLSHTNKFDVTITLPPLMQQYVATYPYLKQFQNLGSFRAMSCSTPGAALRTNETHNQGIGPRIKQAFNAGFPDIRITFLADAEAILESTFTLWMNLAYNYSFSSTSFASFLTNYRSDIVSPIVSINKYDRNGNIISTYVITNALPTVFISQPLSWEETNNLNKFTLGLHYVTYDLQ